MWWLLILVVVVVVALAGLATHDRVCANYLMTLRMELLRLAQVCGAVHPALVSTEAIEVLRDEFRAETVGDVFGYEPGWGLPCEADREAITARMIGPA